MDSTMIEPKRYEAETLPPKIPDPFMGYKTRIVEGYYFKHLTATPYPISTKEEHDKFVADHTKHYIFASGFSDWGLPNMIEQYEVDITTLKEVK